MNPALRALLVVFAGVFAFGFSIPMTMFAAGVGEAESFFTTFVVLFALCFPFWLPALFPILYLRRLCGVLLLLPCFFGMSALGTQLSKWTAGSASASPIATAVGITLTVVSCWAVGILFLAHPNRHPD